LIQASIKNAELGYVGTVTKVNTTPLEVLLEAGYIPAVSPISLHPVPEAGEMGLNINADAVAGEIAAAVGAERLIFLTDVAGVCDQSGKLLSRLSPDEAGNMIASGVASGGMIPKIEACLKALAAAATTCIIDGRQPHALFKEIENGGSGTTISLA
jgi:acetylglutamate kinase